jgi:c-di-GMP-binding flagellar brake protein YcgR
MNDIAIPVPPGTDFENCLVHSHVEILGLLRDIANKRALLTIHFNEGAEFIVTSLLAVNPDFEEVVIDCGADRRANAHLLEASRLTVVTFLDHIKIQFVTGRAQETTYQGHPAFRIRVPESMLRLQRRNYYRVKVPLGRPVLCRVPRADHPGRHLDLKVLDISVGGIALLTVPETFDREVGQLVEECRVTLPEHGDFHVSLEVRNSEMLAEGPKQNLKRLGCQFIALPGTVTGQIQRYILQIERGRLGVK